MMMMMMTVAATIEQTLFLCMLCCCSVGHGSSWSEWWTYEGISGPDFWGLVNPDWYLCSRGQHQSPVDIDPRHLLFDPHLKPFHMDRQRVSGTLINTGHDVKLTLDDPYTTYVNISGGPFSYQYRVHEIVIHFGKTDSKGSEHSINGLHFPAEIQILGYNTDLYGNVSQALYATNGLSVIVLLAQLGPTPNREFSIIAQHLKLVKYKGQQARMRHVNVRDLIPDTDDYMTYEGSLTQPGCHETVTWLLVNKPIYISHDQLGIMRELMQGDESNPKIPMFNNFRPSQLLNQRTIRTNINFQNSSAGCTAESEVYYQANILSRR